MTDEKAHLVGHLQYALDAVVELAGIPAREIAACGATVGHEERVAREGRVADDMDHAGRRVAGGVEGERLHRADFVGVAIFKERVELRTIALELGAFVEDFAKGLLHVDDLGADADFPAELLLQVRRGRQVVGVDMGLDDPLCPQTLFLNKFNDLTGAIEGQRAAGLIEFHHRVDDGAGVSVRFLHHIGDRVRSLVKEARHDGFQGQINRNAHGPLLLTGSLAQLFFFRDCDRTALFCPDRLALAQVGGFDARGPL